MNWDTQISSMLSAADGSVAKMRDRLSTAGKISKGVLSQREVFHVPDYEGPPLSQTPLPSFSPAVHWGDLAAIQAQLQRQSQAIESLTQTVRSMERERDSQHRHLQALQEELQRLRDRGEQRERTRAGPGEDYSMKQWRREVDRELSSLRDQVSRLASLSSVEENFSSKLQREEMEHLRREVDQLKQQLRRQEEDLLHQQSETRETRRECEWKCKVTQILESLMDSYRTHSLDLTNTTSQYQNTQRDVMHLKLTVSELDKEVRGLMLKDRHSTSEPMTLGKEQKSQHKEQWPSDSGEESSPTPSLGDVSSDDLSWLAERESEPRQIHPHTTLSLQLPASESGETGSSRGAADDKYEDSLEPEEDLGVSSDSFPELSVSDL